MIKKKNLLYISIIIILNLIVLIYFGTLKKGMHFDEFFSYFNTNNSFGREAYDRAWVTKDNILKDFYVIDGEQFNYKNVVRLQSFDVHPPVFYICLHTVCSFMPGIFSYWQGLSLNILYIIISNILVYLIIKNITNNSKIAFGLALIILINPGTISNAMFIRMYALMTLWIMIAIYLHIKMDNVEDLKFSWIYILSNAIVAYLGFLTHYFYLVFLFFMEASYFMPRIKFKKNVILNFIKYFISILIAGILGVISYPACLGHVNSGYRGTEVKSNILNMTDIKERFTFFGDLLNRYVFNKLIYFYLIIIVMLLVTAYYKNKSFSIKDNKTLLFIELILLPTIGYYLVSVKGSLMGDEAMMRYQLPIYGLIIMCFAIIIYKCVVFVFDKNSIKLMVLSILMLVFFIGEILNICNGNIYYLYKEQENMKNIAHENSSKVCVYIYNNEENKYFIWNDAEQLWQYDKIYFVNSQNDSVIEDNEINSADELIVYVSTLSEITDFDYYENIVKRSNKNVTSYNKLYDGTYANAYIFY